MGVRSGLLRRLGRSGPELVIVREYGRDSLLVWVNVLLAPVLAALGRRVGLQSEERLVARIEADATEMRKRGYFVTKTERFALPLTAAPQFEAQWYRVTYELTAGTAKTDPGRRS